MVETIKFNFGDFTDKGRIISLSGRDKGVAIREKWKLDEYEKDENKKFIIEVPKELKGLTGSLIQGLFTKTIENIGIDGFYTRYEFSSDKIGVITDIRQIIETLANAPDRD